MSRIADRNHRRNRHDSSGCDAGGALSSRLVTVCRRNGCGPNAKQARLLALDSPAAHLYPIRYICTSWVVLVLLVIPACPVLAADTSPSGALKNAVTILGAKGDNDSVSMDVQSGPLSLDLYLQVEKPIQGTQQGNLIVTRFLAQTQPAEVVMTAIRLAGESGSVGRDSIPAVPIGEPGLIHLKLTGNSLRPGTTYKGWLVLAAGALSHRWEITLTTGGQRILAVAPIGTLKFDSWPTRRVGSFSFTLYDKSEGGPYDHVRVRFEPSGAPPSKTITSNFSLDTFSFYERAGKSLQRVDLEHRQGDANITTGSQQSKQSQQQQHHEEPKHSEPAEQPQQTLQRKQDHQVGEIVEIGRRGQRTFTADVDHLSPGEYKGSLWFVSDQSPNDSQAAKLDLTIQVRHKWLVPVLVIVFGSVVGWYGSKYVVGARKARDLARQVKGLQGLADDLARIDPSRTGWDFPNEATSYGLARVRVMLSQLALLTSRVLPILVREEEIQQQLQDARQRVSALQLLHSTRQTVQPEADGRPTAQWKLGGLLRRANDILERATFDQTEQAEFAKLLESARQWTAADKREANYRDALVDRLKGLAFYDIDSAKTYVNGELIYCQLEKLAEKCPTVEMIRNADTTSNQLREYDQTMGKLGLLWRERGRKWAGPLAELCEKGKSLDEMYRLVDEEFWKLLEEEAKKGHLQIKRVSPRDDLKTYDLLEVRLESNIKNVKPARMIHHPLRVEWRIVPPDAKVRTTETDGLTLVQYFPVHGQVRIDASLIWEGRRIPIDRRLDEEGLDKKGPVEHIAENKGVVSHEAENKGLLIQLQVAENKEYRKSRAFSEGVTEWTVIALAACFAVATAMDTLYDSTFGSFNQYLALFLWAAGAGTGGNLFKQLGTSSTLGGQSDITLPGASPRGVTKVT